MSHIPTTPDNAGDHAPTAALASVTTMPATNLPTSTSGIAQSSVYGPSPASTYGNTAASSVLNTPLTPEASHKKKDGPDVDLANMLKATHLKNIDGAILLAYSSPSRNRTTATIAQGTSTNSSPDSDRVKAIRDSPTWRPTEESIALRSDDREMPFVRRADHEADDVFGSPGQGQAVQSKAEVETAPVTSGRDHNGEMISNDNAQALLPPSACVFVANLMQTQTDDQLEHHVSNGFSQFGVCYVKIRRDGSGMPFAFVQYETTEDAQRAITQGRGMRINNRPCRTEVAKVNRSLYLSRVTGGPISKDEALDALSRFGEIERVWYSTPTESEMFRLPEGIWVMYKLFQPSRDAQAVGTSALWQSCADLSWGFRDHPHYRLEQPPAADTFRAGLRNRHYLSLSPLRPRQSPGRMLPSPMRRATTDLRSIFVGNLPVTITEEQLFHMFEIYGVIQHIEVVRKPSANVAGVNAFAFIEYHVPEGAAAAILASPRNYSDLHLRVERKGSINPSPRRNVFVPNGGSPRSPYLNDSPDHLGMMFQRGLYAGFTQAAQTQVMPPPAWAPFPFYQPYDPSHCGSFPGAPTMPADNNPAAGLQGQGNGYAQTMSPMQYAHAPGPYPQYTQQPARQTYQWPPAGFAGDTTHVTPTMGSQETH